MAGETNRSSVFLFSVQRCRIVLHPGEYFKSLFREAIASVSGGLMHLCLHKECRWCGFEWMMSHFLNKSDIRVSRRYPVLPSFVNTICCWLVENKNKAANLCTGSLECTLLSSVNVWEAHDSVLGHTLGMPKAQVQFLASPVKGFQWIALGGGGITCVGELLPIKVDCTEVDSKTENNSHILKGCVWLLQIFFKKLFNGYWANGVLSLLGKPEA